jgi:hypothetical protein
LDICLNILKSMVYGGGSHGTLIRLLYGILVVPAIQFSPAHPLRRLFVLPTTDLFAPSPLSRTPISLLGLYHGKKIAWQEAISLLSALKSAPSSRHGKKDLHGKQETVSLLLAPRSAPSRLALIVAGRMQNMKRNAKKATTKM